LPINQQTTINPQTIIIMKKRLLLISLFTITVLFAEAQTVTKDTAKQAPAPTSPVSMPGMTGPLSINPQPLKIQTGIFGDAYVSGAVSGLAQIQNHVVPGDKNSLTDMSNAQIFIQKTEGVFQYFLQFGGYSLPDIGTPYLRAGLAPNNFYGLFPQGYIKLAPSANFSIEVGKLPTLIGAEYTFSFENMNIERGLLWNQENAVNRGVQLNLTTGPVTFAVSVNDGFYSNNYNWIWASAAYTINSSNTLALIGGGSTSRSTTSTIATPLYLNNESIFNIIYTHIAGPLTIQPYLQYTSVPKSSIIGTMEKADTYGAALLVNYSVPAATNAGVFSIPFRVEYINSTGSTANGAANLIYGTGSNAWSATVTPTYQYKRFFARAEFSYVKANKITVGSAFGPDGNSDSQSRALLEIGVLF
jgi:hypothetical protein